MSLLPSDPWNERRRPSNDLWGDPLRKHLLESGGQTQVEDEKNFQVAPIHVPANGEEPSSVMSIQCHYTMKQKQLVVIYARHYEVCPAH